ncbi:DUF3995 domain-containing protein [Kribbella sp. NPDC050124]|uniref:DUF3995 domain-containing protein n=1 Tax=Kribbella sp. NPDC050124 TaxID=3364114 RepID=UPI00379647AF
MIRTVVPVVLVFVLAVIGVLHFVWAVTPWPWRDKIAFTKAIYGSDSGELPPPPLSALVGAALLGSAVLTLMVSDAIPGIGPDWLQFTGMVGLALVMLGRGAGGYFMNAGRAAEFRRWNSVLYSPLCLGLFLLATVVAVSATAR